MSISCGDVLNDCGAVSIVWADEFVEIASNLNVVRCEFPNLKT